jgi:hypothetical protein
MNILIKYNTALKAKPLVVTSLTTGFCYGLGDVLAQEIEIRQGKKVSYDKYRIGVMTVFGIFLGGPIYYVWFSKIERVPQLLEKIAAWNERRILVQHFSRELEQRISSNSISDMSMKAFRTNYKDNFDKIDKPLIRSKTILVAKIYADQFLFSPLYIAFFLMSTGIMMDGQKYDSSKPFLPQLKEAVDKSWVTVKKKFVEIFVTDCAVWPLAQMANFAFIPSHLQPIFVNIVNIGWNTFLSYASRGH